MREWNTPKSACPIPQLPRLIPVPNRPSSRSSVCFSVAVSELQDNGSGQWLDGETPYKYNQGLRGPWAVGRGSFIFVWTRVASLRPALSAQRISRVGVSEALRSGRSERRYHSDGRCAIWYGCPR